MVRDVEYAFRLVTTSVYFRRLIVSPARANFHCLPLSPTVSRCLQHALSSPSTILSDGLVACKKLKEVDASRNRLNGWPVLPPTPSLIKVNLNGNNITSIDGDSLATHSVSTLHSDADAEDPDPDPTLSSPLRTI